jgi:hypothetical protein
MMQADNTPSCAFPRALRCPICPPSHGGDLWVYWVEVDEPERPQWVKLHHSCRRCDHDFVLRYALGPEDGWEFSMEMGMCPDSCAVVHGLYGEAPR